MLIRTRRGLILPAAVAFVLLFVLSAHFLSNSDSWSQWASISDETIGTIPHDIQSNPVVRPPIPQKITTPPTPPAATSSAPAPAPPPQANNAPPPQANNAPPPQANNAPPPQDNKDQQNVLLQTAGKAEPIASLNYTFDVPDDIVYDPAGPRPDQVVILTAADRGGHHTTIPDMHGRIAANRKAYCDLHGYKYHFVDIGEIDLPNADTVWKKIPAIVQSFNTYPDAQWVLVLDLDIIIMNPERDLNSLILSRDAMQEQLLFSTEMHGSNRAHTGSFTEPKLDWKNMDFIISQDHNGVNAGAFLVRRSAFSQLLMDMWVDPFFLRNKWGGPEQDAMRHLARHHPVVRKHFGLMRQRVLNAFYEGDESMAYHDGDLAVHLAGCWVTDSCAQRFEDMWDRRKIAQTPGAVAAKPPMDTAGEVKAKSEGSS